MAASPLTLRSIGTSAADMTSHQFQVGDIVTRDGSDRQRVVEVGEYNDITVECIKPPSSGWCGVGERELNLAGRYQLVERPAA